MTVRSVGDALCTGVCTVSSKGRTLPHSASETSPSNTKPSGKIETCMGASAARQDKASIKKTNTEAKDLIVSCKSTVINQNTLVPIYQDDLDYVSWIFNRGKKIRCNLE